MSSGRRVNVCFHGIGEAQRAMEPGESIYWITEGFFGEVIAYLSEQPGVGVSFDDGNISDYEVALPALQHHRMRAAFFPIAARMNQPGSLGSDHLKSLLDAGMTVGSHGMYHQPWRGLDDAMLTEELVTARDLIALESGSAVSAGACPLGRYDRRVLRRMRELGYTQVFTSDRSTASPRAWLQPRYSIRASDTMLSVQAMFDRPPLATRLKAHARIAVKRWR